MHISHPGLCLNFFKSAISSEGKKICFTSQKIAFKRFILWNQHKVQELFLHSYLNPNKKSTHTLTLFRTSVDKGNTGDPIIKTLYYSVGSEEVELFPNLPPFTGFTYVNKSANLFFIRDSVA